MTPSFGILRPVIAVALAAVIASQAARADIITLLNGRTIRGRIIAEGGGRIVLQIPGGKVTVRTSQVADIERESEVVYRLWQAKELFSLGKSKEAVEELRRAAAAAPASAAARAKLIAGLTRRAKDLELVGSLSGATAAYHDVVALAPESADAKRGIERIREKVENLREDIAEAKQLVTSGKHVAARFIFEGVLDDSPEMRPELARFYARSLVDSGDRAYAEQDYKSARQHYGKALEFDPLLAQELESRIVNARLHLIAHKINTGFFEEAERELTILAEFSPANLEVKYITGRYAEVRGNFREAAMTYARALKVSLAGNPGQAKAKELRLALQKKLDIRHEKQETERRDWARSLPGAWMVLATPHFSIHHHNPTIAEAVGSTAEFHYGRIITELALGETALDGRLRIYIHRDAKEFVAATGQPEWSGGVSHMDFRGRKLADQYIASYQASPRLLKAIVPHELTHVLFAKAIGYGREFPLALHEGVAVAMEPEFKQRHYRSVIWNHLRTETLIPMKELLATATYPEEHELFYAQSSRLVAMLLSREPPKKFLQFARRLKDVGTEQALRDVYRIDGFEELDMLYHEYVKPKRIDPRALKRAG